MLLSLNVKNLALIENAEVSFGNGLNIFTGETGAGKSLVIGSVNLALGGRAKADMVRDESVPAEIEIVFSLDDKKILSVLESMEIPVDEDGTVIIRRRIADGRSSAKINGRTVTGSELKEISSLLIDVHAQSEHQSLLYEKNHLMFLDRFAGKEAEDALMAYREKYDAWKKLENDLLSMDRDENIRKREADLLEFEINEIEEAALKSGEDTELEDRFHLMNNHKKITEALGDAYGAVSSENDGAAAYISRALRSLGEVGTIDEKAGNLQRQLGEIDSLLSDFQRDMDDYISGLEFSPEEYSGVTKRLDLINNLKMKYGNTLDDIFLSLKERRDRFEILSNYDEHLMKLKDQTKEAYILMEKAAGVLTEVRLSAAVTMGLSMEEGLKNLNFDESRFEVRVVEEDDFTYDGRDRVYFMISTNPGEGLKPLKDVASGGELSRIMLALKTVLADMDDIGTMIFDEIDTGISGRTAQKVSESLVKLSGKHQVILITHLPQIAAMADNHFLIEKSTESGRTKTGIKRLDREEMIEELGRMLSGASVTDTVMENAREMKELADKRKKLV